MRDLPCHETACHFRFQAECSVAQDERGTVVYVRRLVLSLEHLPGNGVTGMRSAELMRENISNAAATAVSSMISCGAEMGAAVRQSRVVHGMAGQVENGRRSGSRTFPCR